MTTITRKASHFLHLVGGDAGDITLDLEDFAGDFASDFDLGSIERDYRDAIEAAIQTVRPEWTLMGDEVHGPADADDSLTDEDRGDLDHELDAIDLGAIFDAHDLTD